MRTRGSVSDTLRLAPIICEFNRKMNIFYRSGEKALSKIPSRSMPWVLPRDFNAIGSMILLIVPFPAYTGQKRNWVSRFIKKFVESWPRFTKLNASNSR